jgi:hypothetical protein
LLLLDIRSCLFLIRRPVHVAEHLLRDQAGEHEPDESRDVLRPFLKDAKSFADVLERDLPGLVIRVITRWDACEQESRSLSRERTPLAWEGKGREAHQLPPGAKRPCQMGASFHPPLASTPRRRSPSGRTERGERKRSSRPREETNTK